MTSTSWIILAILGHGFMTVRGEPVTKMVIRRKVVGLGLITVAFVGALWS